MKKIFIFGILVLVLMGFVGGQERDTGQVVTEVAKYQAQIDDLKAELDEVKKEAYEKAIEGVNRSISHVNTVATIMGIVVVLLGAIVGYAVIRARGVEREVRDELKDMKQELRENVKDMREKIKYECERVEKLADKIGEDTEKAAKLRQDIEITKSTTDRIVQEMESKYREMMEMREQTKTIEKGINKKKESIEKLGNEIITLVHFIQGYSLVQKGNLWEGIVKLKKAVETNPEFGMAYTFWGVALCELASKNRNVSLYRESIEKNKLAIKYKGDLHTAYGNWGYALIELGKLLMEKSYFIDGLEKTEKAIQIKKDDKETRYNKATAHSLLNEKDKALDSLERAIELDAKLKERAKKDEDFKWLWDDKEFKKLVGSTD